MRIVFASRLFAGVVSALAMAWRRLARWAVAACLTGTACIASQAQDDAARIHQWYDKLAASTASLEARTSGLSYLPAVPQDQTLAEIKADRYTSEKEKAFNVADFVLLHELGSDLAAILRVPAPPGFKNEPVLNLDTLRPYPIFVPPPFGLRYQPIAGDGAAFITHKLLLSDWLHWKRAEVVDTVEVALDSNVLYRSVFHQWAGLRVAARLPIELPPGSVTAAALLGMPADDTVADAPPAAIVVAVIQDNRVVMGSMPLASKLPRSPSCAASARRLDAQGHDVAANRAFRACYSKAFAASPEMMQATQQAQALLERLRSVLDLH